MEGSRAGLRDAGLAEGFLGPAFRAAGLADFLLREAEEARLEEREFFGAGWEWRGDFEEVFLGTIAQTLGDRTPGLGQLTARSFPARDSALRPAMG